MNREPNFDGQDTGDGQAPDAFDLIVAGWRSEGNVPQWPTAAEPRADVPAPVARAEAVETAPTAPQPVVPVAAAPEDEHFVPPEPPPLPRVGPPALVGAALLAIGLVLVLTPAWFGMSDIYGLPLGLIALAAGLGWLVLRLWPDSLSAPDRDEGDDGAIL